MRTNNIKSVEDGYIALIKDLFRGYDTDTRLLSLNYQDFSETIKLTTLSEMKIFISCISEFAIDKNDMKLIRLRYGLSNGKALTLKEVASVLGISDEYVRSRIRTIQRKLSHRINVTCSVKRMKRLYMKPERR